eukprot:5905828-Prymnesium_polylepis.1
MALVYKNRHWKAQIHGQGGAMEWLAGMRKMLRCDGDRMVTLVQREVGSDHRRRQPRGDQVRDRSCDGRGRSRNRSE